MASGLETISRFVDAVGSQVNLTFKAIDDFIDLVVTFFNSMGFWISILVFILMFISLIVAPLVLARYWNDIKKQYTKIVNNIVNFKF